MPRLGELLVDAGAVTPEQVDAALRTQQRVGGRLGTLLVEMGFLSESALAQTLSVQLKLPAVSAAALERIPPEVVYLLPRDTAAHHRCVPVRVEGNALWVAMSDPTDPAALAQIEAVARRPVLAMVAPDILIGYALERHYAVPFLRRAAGPRPSPHLDLRLDVAAPAPTVPIAGAGVTAPLYDPYSLGPRQFGLAASRVLRLDERSPAAGRMGPTALGQRLLTAQTQREVFEAAIAFLAQDFARIVTLVLRAGRLSAFLAEGAGIAEQALYDFAAGPADIPVIARVLGDGRPRLGRASEQTLGPLTRVVGLPGERAVLVLPLRCAEEAVGCAVAVEGRDGVEAFVDEYVTAGQKLDLALQLLVLRKRLGE